MRKVVVLNPKGGSGKTTIATNLASHFAQAGEQPVLLDLDPQASSMRWLGQRADHRPAVHGIEGFRKSTRVTRSFQLHPPDGTGWVVVDTPAALPAHNMAEVTRGASAIIVPVLPSDIDIHAVSRCISDLLLVARVDRRAGNIGIVANRVRKNTLSCQALLRFLKSLEIPLIATLRDVQSYPRAVERGLGVQEMGAPRSSADVKQWRALIEWLEARDIVGPLGRRQPRAHGPQPVNGLRAS